MTRIYNKKSQILKRKILRKNMTPAETLVWNKIKDKKLGGHKFRRQYSVGRYVLDFYCPTKKLAVEIDGGYHKLADAKLYDPVRQSEIESLGIKFIRFSNNDIENNIEKVLKEIKRACRITPSHLSSKAPLLTKERET
ncbi:MAG: endonuclease domain-containing protein [Patescibacteria group bacterium]